MLGDGLDRTNTPSVKKGHKLYDATTDYFTKWVEVVPLKKVATRDVIDFVREHILYRFGTEQIITTGHLTRV